MKRTAPLPSSRLGSDFFFSHSHCRNFLSDGGQIFGRHVAFNLQGRSLIALRMPSKTKNRNNAIDAPWFTACFLALVPGMLFTHVETIFKNTIFIKTSCSTFTTCHANSDKERNKNVTPREQVSQEESSETHWVFAHQSPDVRASHTIRPASLHPANFLRQSFAYAPSIFRLPTALPDLCASTREWFPKDQRSCFFFVVVFLVASGFRHGSKCADVNLNS